MSTPMMRRCGERLAAALVLGGVLSTFFACERDASGLTEWTPADHDHQAEPRQRRTAANMAQKQNPHSAPGQKNQVIDVTWLKQCATCHGKRGKGDGPSSTMVKARDLTNVEFQASVTDEQLKKTIREGKDKMPAFNLPDSVIDGLVAQVRSFAKAPEVIQASALKFRSPPGATGDDEAAAGAAPNAPANAPAPAAPAGSGSADKAAPAPTRAPAGSAPSAPPPQQR